MKNKRREKSDKKLNINKKQSLTSNAISNRYVESQITLTTRARPSILQNDNILTMKQDLLGVNSKSFQLRSIKEYRSELRLTDGNKNKTQETSHVRINKQFTKKEYPYKQRSNLYEKCVWVTIPITYAKTRSSANKPKNNFFCETKFSHKCDSKSLCLDKDHLFTSESKTKEKLLSLSSERKLSSPNHSLLFKIHQRYIDILKEVKKIIKADIISKRKLKYVLKKQRLFDTGLNTELHSICINECCKTENKQKYEYKKIKENAINLQYLQSTLNLQPNKTCSGECNKFFHLKNINVAYNANDLLRKGLNHSSFVCDISTQSNISSRSPSPALPLTKEEALLNKHLKNSSNNLSLIEKLEELNSTTTYDLQFKKNLNCIINSPKHRDVSNHFIIISKSSKSDLLTNTILCERSENPVLVNETVNCENNSSTLTNSPLKSCSSQCCSSNSFIHKKCLATKLNQRPQIPRNDNLTTSYFQSSLSKTYSSEISRSNTPLLTQSSEDFNDLQQNLRQRKRSVSVTKMTCNFSQTISKNSKFLLKRSCSKDSNLTTLSSTRYSRMNYSCSSESTSSVTYRTSRPASSELSRSRSPSIPRRYGSPSFLDRRRITSARKRPIPYHRSTPSPSSTQSSMKSSKYSSCSTHSYSSSRSQSVSSLHLIS